MGRKRDKNVTWAIRSILPPDQVDLFDQAPSISDPQWIDAFSKLLWVQYWMAVKRSINATTPAEIAAASKRAKYIEEELRKLKYLHDITLQATNAPSAIQISVADPSGPGKGG